MLCYRDSMAGPAGEKTVELFFQEDLPAWRITVPQPGRFSKASYDIQFRLFTLPSGTLIGCWLRLYDVPDQPYFVHRVLDLGDAVVQKYLRRLLDAKRLMLVFQSTGEADEGFSRRIDIAGDDLGNAIRAGLERVRGLGPVVDEAALDDFMSVFNAALRARGDVGRAWAAVQERYPLKF